MCVDSCCEMFRVWQAQMYISQMLIIDTLEVVMLRGNSLKQVCCVLKETVYTEYSLENYTLHCFLLRQNRICKLMYKLCVEDTHLLYCFFRNSRAALVYKCSLYVWNQSVNLEKKTVKCHEHFNGI